MKRYLITTAVLLVVASVFSTWKMECRDTCSIRQVAVGLPIFLSTPVAPDTDAKPQFIFWSLVTNIIWLAAVSVGLWSVIDTFGRWQDRRRPPPGF